MGLIGTMFLVLFHLLAVALDVTFLFLLVRLLRRWRPWKPLVAFDRIGTPLVQYVSTQVDHLWRRVSPNHYLTDRDRLLMALALVCTVRLLIGLPLAMVASG